MQTNKAVEFGWGGMILHTRLEPIFRERHLNLDQEGEELPTTDHLHKSGSCVLCSEGR